MTAGAAIAVELPDAAATERAGRALAECVRGGDAVALVGELGTGKTTLVAGLCAELGASGAHSPSFALVHEYRGGRLIVWHVDLYRIERERDLAELGLDELFGDPRGLVVVEWADRFAVMPPDHLRVELAHDGNGRLLSAAGERADAFGAALAAAGLVARHDRLG
jgi:tRNA threonylcarbamoyladenosine biosynthesis protein TsaE